MAVDVGLDTGDVYAEEDTPIDESESAEELRRRLVGIGSRLLEVHLAGGLAGLPTPRPQVGEPTYAEKIRPEELQLHWDVDAGQLHRVVRLGRAWTTFRGKRLRVLEASPVPPADREDQTAAPATEGAGPGALHGEEVTAGEGTRLRLITVQPEGRQPMDAADWLRGIRPEPGERLGV
jgi:methionyl-tRNA formyltransferase